MAREHLNTIGIILKVLTISFDVLKMFKGKNNDQKDKW